MLPLKNIRERDVFSDVADNGVPELFSILFFLPEGMYAGLAVYRISEKNSSCNAPFYMCV